MGRGKRAGRRSRRGLEPQLAAPAKTDDARYLAALDETLAAIGAFASRYLVLSAGFDIVAGDPLGGFDVTREGLREIGRRIAALGLPTLIVQEGGYLLESLGESVVALLGRFVS